MRKLLSAIFVSLLLSLSAHADAFDDAIAAYKKGDYKTALKLWKPLAEQGHASAQFNLGVMYENGEGVEFNSEQSFQSISISCTPGKLIRYV